MTVGQWSTGPAAPNHWGATCIRKPSQFITRVSDCLLCFILPGKRAFAEAILKWAPRRFQNVSASRVFQKRMKEIMLQCFLAVKSKLDSKLGYFDLIGCDFLIDEDFKVLCGC